MDSPQPTREQFDELKTQVAELEERLAAIEGACRAFAVVIAIPRITPGDDGGSGG